MRRILLSPSWWLRHALMIVLVALFLRLGWWQFTKGESSRGTLQNLFYGIEWPFFAGCVIFGWSRMIVDDLRGTRSDAASGAPGQAVPGGSAATGSAAPAGGENSAHPELMARAAAASTRYESAADDEEDDELAEYNRYLAALAAHHEARGGR